MRAVLTRVKSASVTIDGKLKDSIGKGFLVLLGVHESDTEQQAEKIADKDPDGPAFQRQQDRKKRYRCMKKRFSYAEKGAFTSEQAFSALR